MADLLTHACVALLLKKGQQRLRPQGPRFPSRGGGPSPSPRAPRSHLAAFTAGTLLPDLLGRLPAEAFARLDHVVGGLPPILLHGWEPFHLPLGMLIASAGLAVLFRADQRRPVFWNLLLGMLLHLGVDLLQDHGGAGYLLLFPLSTQPYELGLLSTEATVWLAPALALLTLFAWRRDLRPTRR